ncbi:MAG: SDR family NAD(P)-dependent oxidoreductase, partial [Anaerohalosphaeraceae bacterium]
MDQKTSHSNLVAIVTGGGQGIGLCIAQSFLRAGMNVVVAEYNASLQSQAETFLDAGDKLLFIQTDVSSETSVQAMVEQTVKRLGRIDFLINNAATASHLPIEALTFKQWQTVLDVNLSGP